MGAKFVVGFKPYAFKIRFYSDPLTERDAANLVLDMRCNMGYDTNLYKVSENGKRGKVSDSGVEKLAKE